MGKGTSRVTETLPIPIPTIPLMKTHMGYPYPCTSLQGLESDVDVVWNSIPLIQREVMVAMWVTRPQAQLGNVGAGWAMPTQLQQNKMLFMFCKQSLSSQVTQ